MAFSISKNQTNFLLVSNSGKLQSPRNIPKNLQAVVQCKKTHVKQCNAASTSQAVQRSSSHIFTHSSQHCYVPGNSFSDITAYSSRRFRQSLTLKRSAAGKQCPACFEKGIFLPRTCNPNKAQWARMKISSGRSTFRTTQRKVLVQNGKREHKKITQTESYSTLQPEL